MAGFVLVAGYVFVGESVWTDWALEYSGKLFSWAKQAKVLLIYSDFKSHKPLSLFPHHKNRVVHTRGEGMIIAYWAIQISIKCFHESFDMTPYFQSAAYDTASTVSCFVYFGRAI